MTTKTAARATTTPELPPDPYTADVETADDLRPQVANWQEIVDAPLRLAEIRAQLNLVEMRIRATDLWRAAVAEDPMYPDKLAAARAEYATAEAARVARVVWLRDRTLADRRRSMVDPTATLDHIGGFGRASMGDLLIVDTTSDLEYQLLVRQAMKARRRVKVLESYPRRLWEAQRDSRREAESELAIARLRPGRVAEPEAERPEFGDSPADLSVVARAKAGAARFRAARAEKEAEELAALQGGIGRSA